MAQSIEFLHDIVRGLDAKKALPPQQWLQRPLLPAQRAFLALDRKYRLFAGGVGSGKSFLGALYSLYHMEPGRDGLVVAPTYRMLSTVPEAMILQHLMDNDCSFDFSRSEERLTYNGSTTYFRSAERPDLMRGLSVNWAWGDEGALFGKDVWRIVLGRLRQGIEQEAWLTTTPAGFGWLWEEFVEAESPEHGYVQSGTRENTYLPAEYVQSLERNYSGSFHDQELLGAFTAPSGLVFPEFDRSIHFVEPFEIPKSWKRTAAIDFGYYHPFACLWAAYDGDGRMFVYREYREAQRLLRDHASVLKSERVAYFISDHDSQDRSELHALGIPTRGAWKDVVPGIQSVKARLKVQGDGKPRLYVFKTCPKLAREFAAYSWHQSQSVISDAEKVMKVGDDLCDCLRYLSYFEDRQSRRATFPNYANILGV